MGVIRLGKLRSALVLECAERIFSIVCISVAHSNRYDYEAYGKTDVGLPDGPPFFRFSDADERMPMLLAAGFAEPEVQDVNRTWSIREPETPFRALMRGGVRVAAILKAQTPEALGFD